MIRGSTLLWATLALLAGCALFLLKYQVQSLEAQLAGINRQIRDDRTAIHILRAEWGYLNDPARLAEQAERHLGLRPLGPESIVSISSLPLRPVAVSGRPGPQQNTQQEPAQRADRPADTAVTPWASYPARKPLSGGELASVRPVP